MLVACWSVKGGVGVSVVAASIALSSAPTTEALLVDLGGDLPALLGLPDGRPDGVADWLAAGEDVPADALRGLEVEVVPGVRLLPVGCAPMAPTTRADLLVDLLAADHRTVVVDCGTIPGAGVAPGALGELALALAGGASRSLLVVRPCILGLRRALAAPLRPSGLVVVAEPGRALSTNDLEDVVGVPVVAEVAVDPRIARLVDAGLFAVRAPQPLLRRVRRVA